MDHLSETPKCLLISKQRKHFRLPSLTGFTCTTPQEIQEKRWLGEVIMIDCLMFLGKRKHIFSSNTDEFGDATLRLGWLSLQIVFGTNHHTSFMGHVFRIFSTQLILWFNPPPLEGYAPIEMENILTQFLCKAQKPQHPKAFTKNTGMIFFEPDFASKMTTQKSRLFFRIQKAHKQFQANCRKFFRP